MLFGQYKQPEGTSPLHSAKSTGAGSVKWSEGSPNPSAWNPDPSRRGTAGGTERGRQKLAVAPFRHW